MSARILTETEAARWCDVSAWIFGIWVEKGAVRPVSYDERGRLFDATEIGRLALWVADRHAANGENRFGQA